MSDSPFAVRGLIEGFYGVFYTVQERNDLIQFLAQHGYNLYIYGPKNDPWHHEEWREPYPADVLNQLAESVAAAQAAGLTFCYAISPGLSICYSSPDDFDILTTKLRHFYGMGVRSFSLFLDDLYPPSFHHDEDRATYPSYAAGQVDLCNRLYGWLKTLDSSCTLSMCPTFYHGMSPYEKYILELGEGLHPEIDVFYTGPEVCTPVIPTDVTETFAEAMRRRPIIWDNYPVNDLDMASELHIGPITGRDPDLYKSTKGIVVNPMLQAEATKVPLLTFADYFANPEQYHPITSWEKALREVGGGDEAFAALYRFAENSLPSCLGSPETTTLRKQVNEVLEALQRDETPSESAAIRAFDSYVRDLEESSYYLKIRLKNVALRNDLLPWLDLFDNWIWMAQRCIKLLRAIEDGQLLEASLRRIRRFKEVTARHHKKLDMEVLLSLADVVIERAEAEARKGTEAYAVATH